MEKADYYIRKRENKWLQLLWKIAVGYLLVISLGFVLILLASELNGMSLFPFTFLSIAGLVSVLLFMIYSWRMPILVFLFFINFYPFAYYVAIGQLDLLELSWNRHLFMFHLLLMAVIAVFSRHHLPLRAWLPTPLVAKRWGCGMAVFAFLIGLTLFLKLMLPR